MMGPEDAKKRLGFTFSAQEVEVARFALAWLATSGTADARAMAAPLAVKLLKRLATAGLRGEARP